VDRGAAREFFETYFEPHAIEGGTSGFVTGYYEPEVTGARARDARFSVPVYGRPDDLVTVASETERARFNDRITGFRNTDEGRVPYFTRAEIEAGALQGRGLELLYLDDTIELQVRLTYAGKNGHPYTSIGRLLVARGELAADDIDMDKVKTWLHADQARGRALMQENRSYVFFRELGEEEGREGPLGAEGVALTPGRSLAVDTEYTSPGTPVFVVAPGVESVEGPFRRLMITQDVGSAIRGPQRGDIFWGTGEAAGAIAGHTRHTATFHVLLPKR